MQVEVANHVEAAAVTVVLDDMGHKVLGCGEVDGKWVVDIDGDVPQETILGVMIAIKKDQAKNPKKWAEALEGKP